MYMSRIELNYRRQETLRALASPQVLHAALAASFPETTAKERILWRTDKLGNALYVIIQSPQKPDFTHIVEQFGWPASQQQWETREYMPFLTRLQIGQEWQFRLRANPVYADRVRTPKENRGKVLARLSAWRQKKWLLDRTEQYGFRILPNEDDSPKLEIVQREMREFVKRDGHKISIGMTTFEGALRIENETLLVNTMRKGIGRAKAYGCGMLTLTSLK
jgi:CRISPR system Cascade subunit CasE